MSPSVADALLVTPRKSLAKARLRGETARKFLADNLSGRVVERTFQLAGLTKDQAAREMGYEDASAVSRWIGGVEKADLNRLLAVEVLSRALGVAIVEAHGGTVIAVPGLLRKAVSA